jgi:O-antigen/teichoic acid export membrane protein
MRFFDNVMVLFKPDSLLKYSWNLGIRGATIGLKFLLTLFLGRFFPDEVLGEYGLFSTTILVSYLLLSLSFDGYATRELIGKPREQQATYIQHTFVYFAVAFAIYTSIGILFFNNGFISNQLIVYFVILLFLETITQLVFSLFTILQMPLSANLMLFLSQGAWVAFVLLFWFLDPTMISSIEDVMHMWIFGSCIASAYGVIKITNYYKGAGLDPFNWKWILRGLSISAIFFCSTLAYKTIEYVDKYFIEFKLGTAKLGAYVFYSQIANVMNAIINVTVILMLYPRLIENYMKRDFQAYHLIKKKMYQRIILIGATIAVGSIIFMKFALVFIGKESFYNDISVFYILLVSNIAMNLSFIAHYCIYDIIKYIVLV